MTRCADGLVVDSDLVGAAGQASRMALSRLGRGPDLAVVFVCGPEPGETAEALERAAKETGAATVIGASAPGVIGDGRGVELVSSVSVFLAELPGVRLRSFHLEVMRAEESIAVLGLPAKVDDVTAGVLLADAYSFPIDAFVEQTHQVLPGVNLAGGIAAGVRGAGSTRLMADGVVHDRGAVGVLLGGDTTAVSLLSQGCRPVGPVMTVTRAEGNAILELAGAPATSKLEQVLAQLPPAEQALATRGLQLGIAMDEYVDDLRAGDFLIRALIGADPAGSALAVGDVVTVGQSVQFHVRDADSAAADLGVRLERAAGQGPYAGALLFSCTGRGADFFPSADHDVALVRAGLGASAVAGCFAAGEIGPVAGRNHLHGFTASVLAFPAR